jgi:hypothetical protein
MYCPAFDWADKVNRGSGEGLVGKWRGEERARATTFIMS